MIDLRAVAYGERWRLLAPMGRDAVWTGTRTQRVGKMSTFEDGGNRVPAKHWYSSTKLHVVTNHKAKSLQIPIQFQQDLQHAKNQESREQRSFAEKNHRRSAVILAEFADECVTQTLHLSRENNRSVERKNSVRLTVKLGMRQDLECVYVSRVDNT